MPGPSIPAARCAWCFPTATTATVTKVDGIDTLHNVNQILGTGNADSFDLSKSSATAPMTFLLRGGAGNDTLVGNGTERVVADYF